MPSEHSRSRKHCTENGGRQKFHEAFAAALFASLSWYVVFNRVRCRSAPATQVVWLRIVGAAMPGIPQKQVRRANRALPGILAGPDGIKFFSVSQDNLGETAIGRSALYG